MCIAGFCSKFLVVSYSFIPIHQAHTLVDCRHTWFAEILYEKSVCVFVYMYICLSFRTHVSKILEANSSEEWRLYKGRWTYWFVCPGLKYGWSEFVRTYWRSFPKDFTGIKQLKNKVVGLLDYHVKWILSSEMGAWPFHSKDQLWSF